MSISARRVETFGTSIFSRINELAQRHQALNLGQGKPDFDTPSDIVQHLVQALHSGKYSQYAPGIGIAVLRQAVADHAARFRELDIDPARGVIVTAGATEGIFSSLLGLVDPGDEVIVVEPFFDSYVPGILMAGAIPVYVPLHPPTWTFDFDELRAAFSNKTRALIFNSPHNPTGRVFTQQELSQIAELCIEHDVTVISDEVYEHLTFSDHHYTSIASLPGMFERTVSVSSMSKSFSATGWKVGWVYGHPDLVEGVLRAHQYITFSVHHPSQPAVAYALNLPDSYYADFQAMYEHKLNLLMSSMEGSGLTCSKPEGTYFLMANYTGVFNGMPEEFMLHLLEKTGIACIPPESFYSPQHVDLCRNYVRFSFCKTDEALIQVREQLAKLTK